MEHLTQVARIDCGGQDRPDPGGEKGTSESSSGDRLNKTLLRDQRVLVGPTARFTGQVREEALLSPERCGPTLVPHPESQPWACDSVTRISNSLGWKVRHTRLNPAAVRALDPRSRCASVSSFVQ